MPSKHNHVINMALLPHQDDLVRATEREVMLSGGWGSGKSRALCLKLVMRAMFPGAREWLCRKYLSSLKDSTLKTLLEPEGALPAILPPGTYDHNETKKTIRLYGGGEIFYSGILDASAPQDVSKRGSMTVSGIAVDEVSEIDEAHYRQLRGRMRMTVPGLSNQLYSATNPGPPTHHLAVRFGLAPNTVAQEGCRAICSGSLDNHFLPPEYRRDLASFTGIAYAKYVLGRWVCGDGLCFPTFDHVAMVRHREERWQQVVVGLDHGFTVPAAHLVVAKDSMGNLHVLDEFYKTHQQQPAIVANAEAFRNRYAASAIVCDPSNPMLIAALREAGLPAVEANNDVTGGLQTTGKYMCVDQGAPRFTVEPHCVNFLSEIASYEWEPGKDKPVKSHDHLMDSLRYAAVYLTGSSAIWIPPSRIQSPGSMSGAMARVMPQGGNYSGGISRGIFDSMKPADPAFTILSDGSRVTW